MVTSRMTLTVLSGTAENTQQVLGKPGRRAFPVAGPTIWNTLPDNVISAPSLTTFRLRLKSFLFQASFSDITIDHP